MKIIVVDDHPVFREGMRLLLARIGNIDAVDLAINGDDILKKVDHYHYDIALVNISMPGMDGFETIIRAKLAILHFNILLLHSSKIQHMPIRPFRPAHQGIS